MNTKRLLKLADHLDTIPKKAFNMHDWGEETPCGTVACALGHAGFLPAFRRAGLKSEPLYNKEEMRACNMHQEYDVVCDGRKNLDAAVVFFGITERQAEDLFMPDSYPYNAQITPKQVAKKIRRLCK